jgi:hypothetical protein
MITDSNPWVPSVVRGADTGGLVLQRITLEEEVKALMHPVRNNKENLEEGLSELADLSQMVQQELQSQKDMLDGLLETMEKTISIEVR